MEEIQKAFDEAIDATFDYVSSVFLIRWDLFDNIAEFVTADEFTEGLLRNKDLYALYKINDKEKMRQIIIDEAFSYIDDFIASMIEVTSWNDLYYHGLKQKEKEKRQKGGRH